MKNKNNSAKDNRRPLPFVLKWSANREGILTFVKLISMSAWLATPKCAEFRITAMP